MLHLVEQLDLGGGADQRGVLGAIAHRDMQRMVAFRQICRNDNGCSDDEPIIHHMGNGSVAGVGKNHAPVRFAVLKGDGGAWHIGRADIHQHMAFGADIMQDGGCHQSAIPFVQNLLGGLPDSRVA